MLLNDSIPPAFRNDDRLARRLKVAVADGLVKPNRWAPSMDEGDWTRFAIKHGLENQITRHDRFLRSLRFDDPDYAGHVANLVSSLFDDAPEVFVELFQHGRVQAWLSENEPDLLAPWKDEDDPIVHALGHALSEVEAVSGIIDLKAYVVRIEGALPHDPHLAIGTTKDMLEATMRTILRNREGGDVDKLDFPALATKCFSALGLNPTDPPAGSEERHYRKMIKSARSMIEAANELRNDAGTGHGRVVGEEVHVAPEDVSLVASSGLVLAAWLLRRHGGRG
jgi:hypothetical protein